MPAEVPSHWVVYFAVDDADAAVAKIRELGGQVMVGPETIGVGGALRPNTGLKESPFAPLPSFPVPGTNPGVVNPGVPAVVPQPGALTPFPPSSSFRGPDAALQPPELPPAKLVPFPPEK